MSASFPPSERPRISSPAAERSEGELLARWRAGDRGAGQVLFSRHFKEIFRFLESKAGADADDLTQRTFLACLAARTEFREEASVRTYLFTIARHELYRHLRSRQAEGPVDLSLSRLADLVTSPSSRLGRTQQAEVLRAALRGLPLEQQLLLELHYWHELDAAALAEVFGLPAGTIRVRLLRARRGLRERLAARPTTPGRAD